MKLAGCTAVKTLDSLTIFIEACYKSVRAGRRPWLLNAELLDPADLIWFAVVEAATQRWADPKLRRYCFHHALTKAALPKHEFGELVLKPKKREPIVAVRTAHDPCWVTREILHEGPRRST